MIIVLKSLFMCITTLRKLPLPFILIINHLICLCHGNFVSRISTPFPNNAFAVGSKAIIICDMAEPGNLPLFFKHAGQDVSEGCNSYDSNDFKLECSPNNQKPTQYKLIINSIRWKNRGNWSCYHGTESKSLLLKVLVAPVMKPLKLLVKPKISRFVGYYKGLAAVMGSSSFITVGNDPKDVDNPDGIEGHGWKSSPFNLLDPQSFISLQCSTQCAYPQPKIYWNFQNTTAQGSIVMPKRNSEKYIPCTGNLTGQSYQEVILTVSCKNLGLHGKVLIYCATNESSPVIRSTNHRLSTIANLQPLHNSVFVLCPGDIPPGFLTQAEVAAISIGCCLLIFLPFLIYILHKKRPLPKIEDPLSENML